MGRVKSVRPSQAIVVHQWTGRNSAAAAAGRFWILEYSPADNSAKAHPTASVVGDGFATVQADESDAAQVHLPPLVLYQEHWQSVLVFNPGVDDDVSVDFQRWGPGMRLTQSQKLAKLFQGSLAGDLGTEHVSATILTKGEYGDYGTDQVLTALVQDNGDGSATIKYRLANFHSDSGWSLRIWDVYKTVEQTIRTSTAVSVKPSTALHAFTIGHQPRYIVLTTLYQDIANGKTILSLYTMDSSLVTSEANSLVTPNEDLGLKWQVQTFELLGDVRRIAPFITQCDREKYLLLFYFIDGMMGYAQARYLGSGRFAEFVDGFRCVVGQAPAAAPVRETGQRQSETAESSRFSFLSYKSMLSSASLSSRSMDIDDQDVSHEKGQEEKPKVLASATSIPYIVKANGFVWVFFQDAEGNGRYMRHGKCDDIADYKHGWESESWETGLSSMEEPSHFIPVVVPADFMCMK